MIPSWDELDDIQRQCLIILNNSDWMTTGEIGLEMPIGREEVVHFICNRLGRILGILAKNDFVIKRKTILPPDRKRDERLIKVIGQKATDYEYGLASQWKLGPASDAFKEFGHLAMEEEKGNIKLKWGGTVYHEEVTECTIRSYESQFFKNKHGSREHFTFYRGFVIIRLTRLGHRHTIIYMFCREKKDGRGFLLHIGEEYNLNYAKKRCDEIVRTGEV